VRWKRRKKGAGEASRGAEYHGGLREGTTDSADCKSFGTLKRGNEMGVSVLGLWDNGGRTTARLTKRVDWSFSRQ